MTISRPCLSARHGLVALALANAVTVSTLYWGQALVWRALDEFGPSSAVNLMPGATLIGYAAGVAGLAGFGGDLSSATNLGKHFLLLIAALCAAAMAPTPHLLTAACLLIGVGCALTQRLLCCATSLVSPERRAQTIGWIIAAGLCGIVLTRALGPAAADRFGWRDVFVIDALLATIAGLATILVAARVRRLPDGASSLPVPGATLLWRGQATLRQAALQQAVVFAAFNMGWAVFPRIAHGEGAVPSLAMGVVALLGAGAALLSGRVCTQRNTAGVARAGFAAVSVRKHCGRLRHTDAGLVLFGHGAAGCWNAGLVGRQPGARSGACVQPGNPRPPDCHGHDDRLRRRSRRFGHRQFAAERRLNKRRLCSDDDTKDAFPTLTDACSTSLTAHKHPMLCRLPQRGVALCVTFRPIRLISKVRARASFKNSRVQPIWRKLSAIIAAPLPS